MAAAAAAAQFPGNNSTFSSNGISSGPQEWLFAWERDTEETVSSSSGNSNSNSNNDSTILRQTFRLYGSIYLCSFVVFCWLRNSARFGRYFTLRSWVPALKSPLADPSRYRYYVDWMWKVFAVDDDDLLEHCGMDAICYLRALRFGRYLSLVCCFNATWLVPLYATAPSSSSSTAGTSSSSSVDAFVAISISNLSNGSPRLVGTVVAAYVTFGAAMILLHREARWFVRYRHKFLGRREPSNYSIYVSGIPVQYRSSASLAQYFRSCAGSVDAVLEAHIAMNIPDLEAKVARREQVVQRIEHTAALERKRSGRSASRRWTNSSNDNNYDNGTIIADGGDETQIHSGGSSSSRRPGTAAAAAGSSPSSIHHHYKIDRRRIFRLERVETISSLEKELRELDQDIRHGTRAVLSSHDPRRGRFRRTNASKNLAVAIAVAGGDAGTGNSSGNFLASEKAAQSSSPERSSTRITTAEADGVEGGYDATGAGAGAGAAVTSVSVGVATAGFLSRTRERLRTGTVDYDHGDEMDDELRRILVPEENNLHAYYEEDDDDVDDMGDDGADDIEASGSKSFESYNPAELSSGCHELLDDEELLEVLDGASAEPLTPPATPRTLPSSHSTLGKYSTGAAMADPIAEEPSGALSEQTGSPGSDANRSMAKEPVGNGDSTAFPPDPAQQLISGHLLSRHDCSADDEGTAGSHEQGASPASPSLADELNNRFGYPQRSLSSDECMVGMDIDDEKKLDPATVSPTGRKQWPSLPDDWSNCRLADSCGSESVGNGIVDALEPVVEGILLETVEEGMVPRTSPLGQRGMGYCYESSARWSDRSDGSGRGSKPPPRELTLDTSKGYSKMSLLSEPGSGRSNGASHGDDVDLLDIRRQDSTSRLSVHSDSSNKSSSRASGLIRLSLSSGSRAVATSSRRAGSGLVSAGSSVVKGSKAASQTLAKGSRAASQSLVEGSKEVSKTIVKGSRVATSAIKKVAKDASVDKVLESVGETGLKTIKTTTTIASHVVTSAATVVPILANNASGSARDAGFVVFTNLFTTQAALQMVHHPKPTTMNVQEAPDPHHIFWRNVGMPHRARRTGNALSVAATATLCIFWSIPVAFISSLTEVSSLKQTLPGLGDFIEAHPRVEPLLALIAPLMLLLLNETVLPQILKFFAAWEGHISSAMLEASLFVKLGCFMIIQTFFVSVIGGSISAISAELQSILENPASIVNELATALPAQSSYFMQILLTSTFLLQSTELLRVYPLFLAFLRRFLGPNLTPKERRRSWGPLRSLEDPPDFWHAETFAQIILYFVVLFVYATVAPVTGFFLLFCFVLMECGYRYCYIHNYPPSFETGGRLWRCFFYFTLASMVIGQLTLMGLLLLKQGYYAVPALGPLLAVTLLFCILLNHENKRVMSHLPTRDCVVLDDRFLQEGYSLDFLAGTYLQPALKADLVEPDYNVDERD